jgi:hypothetical protein
MTVIEIATLVGQILAGIAIVWAAWSKLWIGKLKPHFAKVKSEADVERNARIFSGTRLMLKKFRTDTAAKRVLCLAARNSGKPLPPDAPIYVSCIDQDCGTDVPNTWKRWQKWECDPSYRELLHDIQLAGDRGILNVTDHMPDGVLKDAYISDGTIASIVFPIHWVHPDNALIYVSINFGEHKEGVTLSQELKTYYENQAREIFRNPEKVREMAAFGRGIWSDR